ncbi:MAG: ATP-binding protein [Pyrinomonadaceae bacterium]|nr:ATP-binding protein [Pyrinomonadaceae bacterium]
MIERFLKPYLAEALKDTPVILLVGARQVGKSTLAQSLRDDQYQPQYLTFDDPTLLSAAKGNPSGFLDSVQTPVIFDEIQRVPELFLPFKVAVDKERSPGRFLLTGSANVLLIPNVADSLAGRMEILNLRPLSQGEIEGHREDFIDWVCGEEFELPVVKFAEDREKLFERMLSGGYPEAIQRNSASRRTAWFSSYIATLLQRDVRDLANIDGLVDFPKLLSILASRSCGLLNYAEVSRTSGLPQTTLKRYVALLENLFLIEYLPAYSGSLTKRMVKAPKLIFTDTGLLSHLQNLTWDKIKFDPTLAGFLTENFVVSELKKQLAWNQTRVQMLHFRTSTDIEVDIVLETPSGEVVGIEIKSGANVNRDAFKGLRVLAESLGKKFLRGIVIYTGENCVAFENNMFAIPIGRLWNSR